MNQIIENKLDPQLSIRYQIIELRNNFYGVVNISGNHAPYIIAIDQDKYGGAKTKGHESFIYRGAIYVRHGDTTIIANRQSRIFEILNKISITNSPIEPSSQLQEYLERNNYRDLDSLEFGHNTLTQGLVEKYWSGEEFRNIIKPAESWVSIIFYPLDEPCKLIPNDLIQKLQPGERIGRDGSWFHGLPHPMTEMFMTATATPKGIFGKWTGNRELKSRPIYSGHKYFSDGHCSFCCYESTYLSKRKSQILWFRFFNWISLATHLINKGYP